MEPFAVAHRTPLTADACAQLHAAGASAFEVDVQLSSRGVVVSHFLPFTPWAEHDNWRFRRPAGLAQDPLLGEVVALLPATAQLLIDPKERAAGRRDELRARVLEEISVERCVVSTDDPADLDGWSRAGARTWRTARDRASLRRLLTDSFTYDGVSVRHTLLDDGALVELRRLTPCVVAWTVNRPARARQLLDRGVAGVTTDRREVLSLVRDQVDDPRPA